MSSSSSFQNRTGENVPEQEMATANQAAVDSGSFDDGTNANFVATAGTAESAAEGAGEGGMAAPDNEAGLEEESGEADKETGDDKAGSKQTTKGVSGKSSRPRQPKITWTAENDRTVLLVGLEAEDKLSGAKNLDKIAQWFREKPSGKAIQVRITKLKKDASALRSSIGFDDATSDGDAGPVAAAPDPNVSPEIDLSDAVFPSIPGVSWIDLPEDLVKQVKAAVEKRKQDFDAEANAQGLAAMHQARMAEQQAADDDRQDAAEALITLSAGPATIAQTTEQTAGEDGDRAALNAAIRALTGES